MLSYESKLQKVLHHQKQKAGKGNSSETGHEVMSVEYHRLKCKLAASPGSISGLLEKPVFQNKALKSRQGRLLCTGAVLHSAVTAQLQSRP